MIFPKYICILMVRTYLHHPHSHPPKKALLPHFSHEIRPVCSKIRWNFSAVQIIKYQSNLRLNIKTFSEYFLEPIYLFSVNRLSCSRSTLYNLNIKTFPECFLEPIFFFEKKLALTVDNQYQDFLRVPF